MRRDELEPDVGPVQEHATLQCNKQAATKIYNNKLILTAKLTAISVAISTTHNHILYNCTQFQTQGMLQVADDEIHGNFLVWQDCSTLINCLPKYVSLYFDICK